MLVMNPQSTNVFQCRSMADDGEDTETAPTTEMSLSVVLILASKSDKPDVRGTMGCSGSMGQDTITIKMWDLSRLAWFKLATLFPTMGPVCPGEAFAPIRLTTGKLPMFYAK